MKRGKVLQFAQWCHALEVRQETEVDEQDAQNAARLRARKARGPRLIPADRWGRKSRPKNRRSRASNLVGTVLAADD
jgi:hypothetical protein